MAGKERTNYLRELKHVLQIALRNRLHQGVFYKTRLYNLPTNISKNNNNQFTLRIHPSNPHLSKIQQQGAAEEEEEHLK